MSNKTHSFEALQLEAFEAVKQKKPEQALHYFKQALLLEPKVVSVHINLSNIYTTLGNTEEALKHLYEAIRLEPQHAESYNNLGRLLYKQARVPDALLYFEKALRINPDYWEAHYNLAHSLSILNQYNQAAAHYEEVLRLVPNHPIAHFNLGLIYVENQNYILAESHLNKALSLDPNNIEALRQLGQVYVQLGRIENAIETYIAALNLDPNLSDVHHNLAILYLRNQDRFTALKYFTEAKRLDPTNDTAKHMVLALSNAEANSAPPEYIKQLFDQYADYYDVHLKTKLHYNAPGLLRQAVGTLLGNNPTTGRVLDLGCGTGMCGVYFRDLALEFIGVDLSPKMIEQATLLGAYEKLIISDINDYLTTPNLEPFDLIIACDVLVYSGELEMLFKNIARVLAPSGRFAFTTELLEDNAEKFRLQPTGRFAHATNYIHKLAKQNQLQIDYEEKIMLRENIWGQILIMDWVKT